MHIRLTGIRVDRSRPLAMIRNAGQGIGRLHPTVFRHPTPLGPIPVAANTCGNVHSCRALAW
jgi:hypothetical protein